MAPPVNPPRPQPPQPRVVKPSQPFSICRFIAISLLTLLIVVGIVVLIIWLVLKPHKMVYSIENSSIHDYNLTNNNHLSGNFNFTLRAYNPNKRISIYYDHIDVKLFFNSQPIAFSNIEPFYQRRRNVTHINVSLPTNDVALYGDIARDFKTQRSGGNVEVEVKIRAKIRFKVGAWKSSHRKLKILCTPTVNYSDSRKNYKSFPCDADV
uniref:Late embryogenesis abundant protein LEA-2 subgroup domain-containing protein n=1 Tax=Solanum lycopersicum TaxID=4081 RepID=A0A3Q7IZ80_SOLLC